METSGDNVPESSKTVNKISINLAPAPMSFEGNTANNWKLWSNKFKLYLKATGMDKEEDSRKSALLVQTMGTSDRIIELFNSFEIDIEKSTFDEVFKKFENHFQPKSCKAVSRNIFFKRKQQPEESIRDYYTNLINLSGDC